jgi:hypothetical protein
MANTEMTVTVTLDALLQRLDVRPGQAKAMCDTLVERQRQDERWGGPEHDDQHTSADWAAFIHRKVGELHDAGRREQTVEVRRVLVQIAALAIAGIEVIDRTATAQDRTETVIG